MFSRDSRDEVLEHGEHLLSSAGFYSDDNNEDVISDCFNAVCFVQS